MFDNCSHSLSEKGWSVGIRTVEPAGTKDARFYFTLRTDRAVKSTTIFSHQRYRAGAWTHLMASYNGHNMTLYVDGAKVCGFTCMGQTFIGFDWVIYHCITFGFGTTSAYNYDSMHDISLDVTLLTNIDKMLEMFSG